MKKWIAILALMLCVCLLAACEGQGEVLGEVTEVSPQLEDAAPSAATATDAEEAAPEGESGDTAPEPAEEPASETDADGYVPTELPVEESASTTDFTELSADQCVADADGAAGQLPRITLDCAGAASINEDIEGSFRYLVDADYCSLYYEYYKNGRILSVMVAQLYDGDASYYTPYNLDLATGERLTGGDLLSLLGADAGAVKEAELGIMGQEYEYQYGSAREGDMAAFYQEQYDRTVSADNADTDRLWLNGSGELCFVAKIYSLAGAEFYEYPMSTGLSF